MHSITKKPCLTALLCYTRPLGQYDRLYSIILKELITRSHRIIKSQSKTESRRFFISVDDAKCYDPNRVVTRNLSTYGIGLALKRAAVDVNHGLSDPLRILDKEMTKLFSRILSKGLSARKVFALCLTLALLSALLPLTRSYAQGKATNKLSLALQQVLNTNNWLIWSDPSKRTVRTLIQTNGPVSSALITAVTRAGGTVVRQFSSINGMLAELPKNQVLSIASRSDVERMTEIIWPSRARAILRPRHLQMPCGNINR